MTAYRVEVSPNNRAGCQDALCKSNSDKIMKGDIRFGVWVEGTSAGGHEFQSFRWRHWGCVSGKTVQNLREHLTGPLADEGEYNWDLFDGLEEMPPDYQEKIKLAIIEGKIADEDWKGDPAYNMLGKTGIRGRASSKKKDLEGDKDDAENPAAAETQVKPTVKKRGRTRDQDEDEDVKPSKKRASKVKKDDEENIGTKPAKKAEKSKEVGDEPKSAKKLRTRNAVIKEEGNPNVQIVGKEENEDLGGYEKPRNKGRVKKESNKEGERAAKMKTEELSETSNDVKPTKKSRGKKVAKQEPPSKNDLKAERNGNFSTASKATELAKGKKALEIKEEGTGGLVMKGEHERDFKKLDSAVRRSKNDGLNGIKEEEDPSVKVDEEGKRILASKNIEDTYQAEMPEDPSEQIALAFCNRDGPLVSEFNEMVKSQEVAGSDWEGFLQKRFRIMVGSGEVKGEDFNGFLQKMHEREVAFGEPAPIAAKRGRKAKKV